MYREQIYQRRPEIIDVKFISDDRAALKALCGDGIRWCLTTREQGERVAREVAAKLAEPDSLQR